MVTSQLSPFSEEDNEKLYSSIKRSVSRIFVCSFAIGIVHMVTTYLAFYICELEFRLLLAFLSGFLAILPVISTWIIWAPSTIYFFLCGKYFNAIVIASTHLFATYYVDTVIYSYIPGGNVSIIGLSIVLGVSAFGILGFLVGPLLTGISVTLFDIYRHYQQLPIPEFLSARSPLFVENLYSKPRHTLEKTKKQEESQAISNDTVYSSEESENEDLLEDH